MFINWNPADRVGAESKKIRGLLNPCVRFAGRIRKQALRFTRQAGLAYVPTGFRRARREEADEVGHVAAAHQQPAARGRIADELRDPSHGLRLDFSGHRRQRPGAAVLIHRRGEKITEHADGCGARRDVSEEARVAVEQRVLEQQIGGMGQQLCGFGSPIRQTAPRPQSLPDCGRRLIRLHQSLRQLCHVLGNLIDEAMAEIAKRLRIDLELCSSCLRAPSCLRVHRSPSNKSVSCLRPPFTRLNTR